MKTHKEQSLMWRCETLASDSDLTRVSCCVPAHHLYLWKSA